MPLFAPFSLSSPKVFLKEGFEGTGYENAVWTEGGGPNPDNTTNAMEGDQFLALTTSASSKYVYMTVDDKNTLHGCFKFRRNSGSGTILAVRVGSNPSVLYFGVTLGALEINHGSVTKTGALVDVDVSYYVWFSMRMGSGSDGFIDVAFSPDGMKPEVGSSYRTVITNGTGTGTFNRIYLGALATSTMSYLYDAVRFSDSEIPSVFALDQTPCFLREDFECATGYENFWVEDGTGTMNEDYTAAPLVGSQSLNLVGATTSPRVYNAFAAKGTVHGYMRVRRNSNTGTVDIFSLRTGSTRNIYIEFVTDVIRLTHGSSSVSLVTTVSAGQEIHIWFSVSKGTGSNGTADIAFSTDGIKPAVGNNRATLSNGTSTANIDRLYLGASANETMNLVYDKIRLSEYEIPSYPS